MKKRFVMMALLAVAMPTAAMANRMQPGFSLPDKPQPEPEPAPPVVQPAPPPPAPPTYTPPPAPAPAPPVYNPPPPVYHPPAPQPQPQPPQYGTFRPYGPLPDGRVHVTIDNSFEFGTIHGYQIAVQDNGANANDQMVIQGPHGTDDVWIDCHVGEEWASYGPNSEEFVHSIVSTYCGW